MQLPNDKLLEVRGTLQIYSPFPESHLHEEVEVDGSRRLTIKQLDSHRVIYP